MFSRSFFLTLAGLCTFATAPQADELCNDLWFTRNAIINQAGYCFGSNLGQALFDNSDCIGKEVQLSAQDQATIALIQENERANACRVDTSARHLDLQDLSTRQKLRDFPIWDDFESACIGWLSPPAHLRAGHSRDAAVVGRIELGDTVRYGHLPQGDWSYAMVFDGDWRFKSAGWLNFNEADEACEDFAG